MSETTPGETRGVVCAGGWPEATSGVVPNKRLLSGGAELTAPASCSGDTASARIPAAAPYCFPPGRRDDLRPELSDDARDAMSLPPRDKGRRFGVQIGRWFIGVSREPEPTR